MAKKKWTKELLHYLILAFLLTAVVFLAHWTSGLAGLEQLAVDQPYFGYPVLFVWYFVFLLIFLIPADLILHKLFKI